MASASKRTSSKKDASSSRGDLSRTVKAVRDKFGDAALVRMSDRKVSPVEVIPTGSIALNRALGTGGWPRGRIVEIYGHESGGKTTMALHAMAECQALGGTVAFVDAEHALDPAYARAIGVKLNKMLLSQPDYGEQALEIVDTLVAEREVQLIVIDSVAALTPLVELEGEMGDSHVGVQARMMGQALRKITSRAGRAGTLVMFINQLREKIGVKFGSPETTPGGRAMRFYASVRVDVRRREQLKDMPGGPAIGNTHIARVKKNKLAPPFREAEIDIIYGKGIDKASDLVGVALELGAIVQKKSWYEFKGENVCQGRFNLRDRVETDEVLRAALLDEIVLFDTAAKEISDEA